MDSKQIGKKPFIKRVSSKQEKTNMTPSGRRKPMYLSSAPLWSYIEKPGRTISREHNNLERKLAEPQESMPMSRKRKRKQNADCEASRERTLKRPRRASSPLPRQVDRLCHDCSEGIDWNEIERWMNTDERTTWAGKMINKVGTRFRSKVFLSPTCRLCQQLHAPWIKHFLENQFSTPWTRYDPGDELRIFRHLRHLPHLNDFPESRSMLRKHNAPCHIAVVPARTTSRHELRHELEKNIAARGLVIVSLNYHPKSDLFVPQQVPPKFDVKVVQPWINSCKGHKDLCKRRAALVKGMRMIDCEPKIPTIVDYPSGQRYVALSYVWGKPPPDETPTPALAKAETPQREDTTKTEPESQQLVVNALGTHVFDSELVPFQSIFSPQRRAVTAVKRNYPATTTTPPKRRDLQFPKEIPQTIQDAIQVTKSLGYRYLWVDRYCIDQNNEAEKQQQFSLMGGIYANSQITIFALSSVSNTGLPGVSLPRKWQQQDMTIGKFKFYFTLPDPYLSIHQSRWATRAWTFQEGLFSTRRLFFTDHQVYFECNGMNCAENFKSNLNILHTLKGNRFRAFHRAGNFVCGNSNKFSHVNIEHDKANHRKIDTILRNQYQIEQYSKRELTYKDDVLNAFEGVARFYAKTTARIINLAGIPIPSPLARIWPIESEQLDHLSYSLAWIHLVRNWDRKENTPSSELEAVHEQLAWSSKNNPAPQRREGFPSWSWVGWFGEIGDRKDLPYCWTSYLSSVKVGLPEGTAQDDHMKRLLNAKVLQFDAYVVNPRELLKFWNNNSYQGCKSTVRAYMSIGPSSLHDSELVQKIKTGEFRCLVIGTHGKPREEIFKAMRDADRNRKGSYHNRWIKMSERVHHKAIVCLVVHTVNGISYRRGLLKIDAKDLREERVKAWSEKEKQRFVLK